MTRTLSILATAAALASGPAFAQSALDPNVTTVCLEVSGRPIPPTCKVEASRIDAREDICQCLKGGTPVKIQVCPKGVAAPGESAAYERERYALVKNGSLVGASWRGQPVCVAGRDTISRR